MALGTFVTYILFFFSNIINEHGTTVAMLQSDCIAAPYCFIEDDTIPIVSYYETPLRRDFAVDDTFINGLNLPAGVGFGDITITDIEFSIKGTHGQTNDLTFTVRQPPFGNVERLIAQQISDNNAVDFDFVLTNNPGANTVTTNSDVNCGGCSYYENNNIGTNLIDFIEGSSPNGDYRIVIQDGDDNAPLQDILGTLQQFCIHTYCYEYVIPTDNPTANPTNGPSENPTTNPTENTQNPTINPTNNPTINPTETTQNPTSNPSNNPTSNPTAMTQNPTVNPTGNPTTNPTENTQNPTINPSTTPTINPTQETQNPTLNPSNNPTMIPTAVTQNPTVNPTESTSNPSMNPTNNPTLNPTQTTENPTNNPTKNPIVDETFNPTTNPTEITSNPTNNPTETTDNPTTATSNPTAVTANPTANPTVMTSNPTAMTANPTANPVVTGNPTLNPTVMTSNPTVNPTSETANPTQNPSTNPIANPTLNPINRPTDNPIMMPTLNPTINPTTPEPTTPEPTTPQPTTPEPTTTLPPSTTPNFCVVGLFLTWADAQQYCQNEFGSSLAIVDSQAKNDELQGIGTPMWLAGSDMEVENTWYWMGNNASTLFYVTGVGTEDGLYSNWGTNRPNSNGNEDCLAINVATEQETEGSGVWDDVDCNDNSNFIVACNCPTTPAPTGITPSPTDNPVESECCLLENGYTITPLDGSSTGGDVIRIDTECLDETDEVECNFDGTITNAFFVDGVAYCPLPPAGPCILGNVKGTTNVYLVVNGVEYPELQTQYTYMGLNTFDDYGLRMSNSWFIIEGDQTRTLTWDTSSFSSNTLRLIGYAYQLGTDNNNIFLDTTTSNDGNEIVNIPNNLLLNGNYWLYNIKFLLIDSINSHYEETNCMCVNDGLVENDRLIRCSCTVCTQKSKIGSVWGDPHYIVVDAQVQYSYQGFGIYRLLYVADIGFEVQSQNNWCGTDPTTGVVFSLDVGCTIGIAIRQPGYPDISMKITSFSFQSMHVLVTSGGNTVQQSNPGIINIDNYVYGVLSPTIVKFWFNNGFKIQYSLVSKGYVHIWYPYHWLWKANGMLGRFNGVAGDDLFPYALAQRVSGTDMFNLGRRYQVIPCSVVIAPYLQRCQNRRRLQTIDPSLIFDTNALDINQTDVITDFDLNNFDPILVAEAQAFCNDEDSCIYDYLLAGPTFATGTLAALDSIREELGQILIVDPFFCVFRCLNGGVCSGQGQCTCIPPYTGDRCQDVDPAFVTTNPTENPTNVPSASPITSPTQNPITEPYVCIEEEYNCMLNCQAEGENLSHRNSPCSRDVRECIEECNSNFDECYEELCEMDNGKGKY